MKLVSRLHDMAFAMIIAELLMDAISECRLLAAHRCYR